MQNACVLNYYKYKYEYENRHQNKPWDISSQIVQV